MNTTESVRQFGYVSLMKESDSTSVENVSIACYCDCACDCHVVRD